MVDFLYRNGLKTKDLFESTALHDDIMKIRDWLDYGSLNPILDNVSAVAECLLLFLQHTKDPIVPYYQMEKCALCTNFNMCQMVSGNFYYFYRIYLLKLLLGVDHRSIAGFAQERLLIRHNVFKRVAETFCGKRYRC